MITRRFLLQTFLWVASASVYTTLPIQPANAVETASSSEEKIEKYQIFMPYFLARRGGDFSIISYSGKKIDFTVRSHTVDGEVISLPARNRNQDAIVEIEVHTLYDPDSRTSGLIYEEIDRTFFLQEASKSKCKRVYEQVEDGRYVEDLEALGLLDYILETSTLDSEVIRLYSIASSNSRLMGIRQAVNLSLESKDIDIGEADILRGTLEYVAANNPVPNFKYLTILDGIVAASDLPIELKNYYAIASAKSRALTVDIEIVRAVEASQDFNTDQFLDVYKKVRDGVPLKEDEQLAAKTLDRFVQNSDVTDTAKAIYLIARKEDLKDLKNVDSNVSDLISELADKGQKAYQNGSSIVPRAVGTLSELGVETATGVSLSSLSGAAATNATLATLGGGSVAAGGLGMLGGLTVVTGGAALIGAAGILSIALVSDLDREDYKNLGISVGSGVLAGAASALAAWTAAGALGVTGTLSGAAAISTTMAALGGVSVLTGGTALIASGTAFLIWSFLRNHKKRDSKIVHQLETRIYTLAEEPEPQSIGDLLVQNLLNKYGIHPAFFAPSIPLDKLSNSLSNWLSLEPDESVLSLIDSSLWGDAKAGVCFTNKRVIWKAALHDTDSFPYESLNKELKSSVSDLLDSFEDRSDLDRLTSLAEIFYDEEARDLWVDSLVKFTSACNAQAGIASLRS